ncbi:MAG: GNAT family N-acetyltransferase [Anaerolineales bacterium]
MDINVRGAVLEDINDINELFRHVDLLHHVAHPEIFNAPPQPPRALKVMQEWISDPSIVLLVATDGDQILGVLHAMIANAPDLEIFQKRSFLYIQDMVVSRSHHRMGIGRMLLEHAAELARSEDIFRIELNVFEFNQPAKSLYLKEGYNTILYRMYKDLRAT